MEILMRIGVGSKNKSVYRVKINAKSEDIEGKKRKNEMRRGNVVQREGNKSLSLYTEMQNEMISEVIAGKKR